MTKLFSLLRLVSFAVATSAIVSAGPAFSKEFTFSDKTNQEMARKLKIPVYFGVPASARAVLPKDIKTTDRLIDFKHPDATGTEANIGLRLYVTRRSGMAKRLAQSGLFQTGDILLTFRPEWGGAGAYPNIQMGISHTGVAYIKNGVLHNIDNPLNEEYLGAGMRSDLTSEHYRTLDFIHVIRPRNLTDQERKNIAAWASRLNSSAKRVYPEQISFNQDYNAPKYKPGKPLEFVKHFGQIALGQKPQGNLDMFCSEFAWSLLSLRDCDPATSGDTFKGNGVPACIKPPMKPMQATGDYITRRSRTSYSGLADGPLLVIDSLKLPKTERTKLLQSVFVENPNGMAKLSVGHKALAESMQPKFAPLEKYYVGAGMGLWSSLKARFISAGFKRAIPENYSPTSYLINTLLPPDNSNRTMDYVATIVIE
jgi:hypothetical protein